MVTRCRDLRTVHLLFQARKGIAAVSMLGAAVLQLLLMVGTSSNFLWGMYPELFQKMIYDNYLLNMEMSLKLIW